MDSIVNVSWRARPLLQLQHMRIPTFAAVLALIALSACEQKTETRTVTDSSGTVQQKTTTVSATAPAVTVDTAATAEMKRDAQEAGRNAADTARDAAHATGTAMETAGKEIQRQTQPAPKKKP